jgi:hypothetical protein
LIEVFRLDVRANEYLLGINGGTALEPDALRVGAATGHKNSQYRQRGAGRTSP